MSAKVPTDEELKSAIGQAIDDYPDYSNQKLRDHIKETHNWAVGSKKFKNILRAAKVFKQSGSGGNDEDNQLSETSSSLVSSNQSNDDNETKNLSVTMEESTMNKKELPENTSSGEQTQQKVDEPEMQEELSTPQVDEPEQQQSSEQDENEQVAIDDDNREEPIQIEAVSKSEKPVFEEVTTSSPQNEKDEDNQDNLSRNDRIPTTLVTSLQEENVPVTVKEDINAPNSVEEIVVTQPQDQNNSEGEGTLDNGSTVVESVLPLPHNTNSESVSENAEGSSSVSNSDTSGSVKDSGEQVEVVETTTTDVAETTVAAPGASIVSSSVDDMEKANEKDSNGLVRLPLTNDSSEKDDKVAKEEVCPPSDQKQPEKEATVVENDSLKSISKETENVENQDSSAPADATTVCTSSYGEPPVSRRALSNPTLITPEEQKSSTCGCSVM